MAQTPETAEYGDMPRSAIATGLVDFVLPPEQMPAQLLAYVRHAFDPSRARSADGSARDACCSDPVHGCCGHAPGTTSRSTRNRRCCGGSSAAWTLHQLDPARGLPARGATKTRTRLEALYRDLLIGVTEFFRDPEAFVRARRARRCRGCLRASPRRSRARLGAAAAPPARKRIRSRSCCTSMMLQLKRPLRIQIFATDIDARAIEHGRAGVYPASIASSVSEERLDALLHLRHSARQLPHPEAHPRPAGVFRTGRDPATRPSRGST